MTIDCSQLLGIPGVHAAPLEVNLVRGARFCEERHLASDKLGIALVLHYFHSVIGSKFSRHFFNQSGVKSKPIVARACTFSRALCRLRVITSSFDWFTRLFASFLIGQSNYFGFGFTTLD